jgi:AcrR family transcriptional regulator
MLYAAASMKKTKKAASRASKTTREPQKRGDAVREALISACERLLTAHAPSEITTAMLLAEADVARGTLYHHFESASALVETTLLEAFSRHVDANITALRALVDHSKDLAEFAEGLRQVTKVSQGAARKDTRFARTRLIAYSESSPTLRKTLSREQERLTTAIAGIVVTGQKKGWVKRSIKPRAAAVLIQAYTLGKIVDDVAEAQMAESDWNALIDEVVIGGMLVRN